MRKLAFSLIIAALAPMASTEDIRPEIEAKLAAKYAYDGLSFAVDGYIVYSFALGSSLPHRVNKTTFAFMRCGVMSTLSISDPDDVKKLLRMRVVRANEPNYLALKDQYNDACWSWDAWLRSGGTLVNRFKDLFK